MPKKIKGLSILVLILSIILIFNGKPALADDNNVNDLGSRIVTDKNKVWTIRFNSELDMTSILNTVQIQDVTNGTSTSVNVMPGTDDYTVRVTAPASGYQIDHTYKLILNNGIKSIKGKNLNTDTVLNFTTISPNNNYSVSGKVEVSPMMSTYKKITLSSSNLPGVEKYKLEGNNILVNIGEPIFSIVNTNSTKVYLCDKKGNVLANSSIDVSRTNTNINSKLSF